MGLLGLLCVRIAFMSWRLGTMNLGSIEGALVYGRIGLIGAQKQLPAPGLRKTESFVAFRTRQRAACNRINCAVHRAAWLARSDAGAGTTSEPPPRDRH